MAEPIQVEVVRGDVVEAVHTVHAVALRDGRIVAEAGDPRLVTYLRSSAKPIQVLPLVRARPDLEDRLIAVACASHGARQEQIGAVRALLAVATATEDDLETGEDPTRIEHTCSGKHAGFLTVCRERGLDPSGYRLREHPLQEELLREIAAAAEVPSAEIPVAVDGCGVPTFALTLDRCANAFARLPFLDGGSRVVAAMRTHPDMLRGPITTDTMFVQEMPDWVAKGGAEGLFLAGSSDGLGVALKVEDGAYRAFRPAVAGFLGGLGIDTGELGSVSLENSRGDRVGVVRIRRKSRAPKRRSRV